LVTIGTGNGVTAVTTGTTALNINAAVVLNALTIQGNDGANALTGTAFADSISGAGGNDTLVGGGGNDSLTGGSGVDTFTVGSGTDTVIDLGQGGADILIVSAGAIANATVHSAWTASAASSNAGVANITTNGMAVNLAAVTKGNGFTVTNTGSGTTLTGSGLADSLTGGAVVDILNGGAGNDALIGAGGNDILNGGVGTDSMVGGEGSDLYLINAFSEHGAAEVADTGTVGKDELRFVSTTASTLTLFSGDTGLELVTIGTGTGPTAVATGTTALNIKASAVGNALNMQGNNGANTLTGTAYADTISGGGGNDVISGGAGDDDLVGGTGNDVLTGGDGSDRFVFDTSLASSNVDTIKDFVTKADKIVLSAKVFTKFTGSSAGSAITADNLVVGAGAKALKTNDYLIYDSTSDLLYYDSDGNGSGAAVAFVKVELIGTAAPVFGDFLVVS